MAINNKVIDNKKGYLICMNNEKSLIEKLQSGDKIICLECKKDFYISAAKDISKSLEFYCPNCKSIVRFTPNILVL